MHRPINHLFIQTLKVASCDRLELMLMVTWARFKWLIKPVAAWGAVCIQICKQHCQQPAYPLFWAPFSDVLKIKRASLAYLPVSPKQNKTSHYTQSSWFKCLRDQAMWSCWKLGVGATRRSYTPPKRQQHCRAHTKCFPKPNVITAASLQPWICTFPRKMFCCRIMKTRVSL